MEKNRLEAFSDGVLAIVITIMILELKLPLGDGWSDLLELWPTLLAYFISFFFIAIYWVNHHLIFQMAEKINMKILWCNIAWLFVMSFIPFATAWVGSFPTSFLPLCLYFFDMFMASVTFHLMYFMILREKGEKIRLGVRSVVSLITYFLAAVFGGFCPIAAFIVVSVVSGWWIFREKKKRGDINNDAPKYPSNKIVSFEVVTLRTIGMRYAIEYEMVMNGDSAEISEYSAGHRGDKDSRKLRKRTECKTEQALGILNKCSLLSWDGFCGNHPKGVLDGTVFDLDATVNGGRRISAHGSQNFPKHYRDLTGWLYEILDKAQDLTEKE